MRKSYEIISALKEYSIRHHYPWINDDMNEIKLNDKVMVKHISPTTYIYYDGEFCGLFEYTFKQTLIHLKGDFYFSFDNVRLEYGRDDFGSISTFNIPLSTDDFFNLQMLCSDMDITFQEMNEIISFDLIQLRISNE